MENHGKRDDLGLFEGQGVQATTKAGQFVDGTGVALTSDGGPFYVMNDGGTLRGVVYANPRGSFVVKEDPGKPGRPPVYTKEERKIRDKAKHKERRLALQAEVNLLKQNRGCLFCRTKEGRLEFHHPDPVKDKNRRIGNIQTRTKLEKELAHVVVLCGKCHRQLHAILRGRTPHGQFR